MDWSKKIMKSDFNPRPPWGGRRCLSAPFTASQLFQSTPSVGRATSVMLKWAHGLEISIHALRGEGDVFESLQSFALSISIHALRGEGDNQARHENHRHERFQSTPSVGRATGKTRYYRFRYEFQSTPSVGRATLGKIDDNYVLIISIHALRGEGDDLHYGSELFNVKFQSTPSVGRATDIVEAIHAVQKISIHALRGEGDSKNIQIYNIVFVHSAYKIIYFCDSCAFYLT